MSTIKLYKFRPLSTCTEVERVEQMLQTSQFWFSRYWELNDPMEGVYRFNKGDVNDQVMDWLFQQKAERVICSFSSQKALKEPLMWGYYGNGFKGCAIELEVEVEGEDREVEPVTYAEDVSDFSDTTNDSERLNRILTTKLKHWSHEKEYRAIRESPRAGLHRVGQVKGLYFGEPYITGANADQARSRSRIKQYIRYRDELRCLADELGINCYQVKMVDSEITTHAMNSGAST